MANKVNREIFLSYTITLTDVVRSKELSAIDKAVYNVLCSRANNETRECWPSVALIAQEANVGESSVKRSLSRLEKKGLVRRLIRKRPNGSFLTTIYTIPWREKEGAVYPEDKRKPIVEIWDDEEEDCPSCRSREVPLHGSTADVDGSTVDYRTILRELDSKDITPPVCPPQGEDQPVIEIFNFWKKRTGHEKAILDSNRRNAIKKGLSFFDAKSCKQAIVGNCNSPFHQGVNKDGKIYDELSLIFRDAAHAEEFREMGELYWRDEDDD